MSAPLSASRVSDPTKNMLTVEKLRQVPEITECHFITGKYNILVKLYCTDNEHLMHTIFDHILQLARGVADRDVHLAQ